MKTRLFTTLIILSFVGYGQNWNVFNKNYRYNYKYNNSQLVSHVLFTDSIEQAGTDTTYYINRVGVVTGTVLQVNQPQFLRRMVIKAANGEVKLQDPSTITIIPTCSVSQTWTFEVNTNLTATCVSISTLNIFNVIDSVRIIVLSSNDSIILAKQFGLIRFPQITILNKYYNLTGIENAATYDSIPLFGEKVPNAWDFYKFNIGDKYRSRYTSVNIGTPWHTGCSTSTVEITGRSVVASGYLYSVNGQSKQAYGSSQFHQYFCDDGATSPTYAPPVVPFSVLSCTNLSDVSFLANRMYPGMVVQSDGSDIVYFGKDNLGTFYKYCGLNTCSSSLTAVPGNTILTLGYEQFSMHFAEGLGQVSSRNMHFEYEANFCKTSAVKNGVEYFGQWTSPPNDIGLREYYNQELLLFPNPANSQLQLPIDLGSVKLYDIFGILVKEEKLENKSMLDISELPNGVYFLEIQTDSFKSSQKLIIQH